MKEIRQIDFRQIPDSLIVEAKRADLAFCGNTQYIGVYLDGRLVAISGILSYKTKVVFKNHYVSTEFRGRGFFKEMLDYLIEAALSKNTLTGEATCTKDSINEYIKRGFIPVKSYRNYTKVRCEDLSKAKRV